jgi:hypothetical protein
MRSSIRLILSNCGGGSSYDAWQYFLSFAFGLHNKERLWLVTKELEKVTLHLYGVLTVWSSRPLPRRVPEVVENEQAKASKSALRGVIIQCILSVFVVFVRLILRSHFVRLSFPRVKKRLDQHLFERIVLTMDS